MPDDYLLVIDGKPQGPFNLQQLKERHIRPADFVKTPEMIDYKEAHEVAELRELFGFKRMVTAPQYFGSFDQRLVAWAIDWFFVLLVCVPVAFFVALFIPDKPTRLLIAFAVPVAAQVVNTFYHIIMECSARQATFGKGLINIKVCDMEGSRINFGRSAGRNLAKLFSTLTIGVGYLLSFFSKKQQCLHDMMAGTLVMKERLL